MDGPSITVTLVDGVRVVVPDTLDLMTPFVLQEQHDWFEQEIKFVRLALEPGDRAIDIGANYGVYTLAMAKGVGPTGHVWSFEPASHPAGYLARSIAENGFTHVTLERSALSSEAGDARLELCIDSELNHLSRGSAGGLPTESVRVTTLDDALETYAWDRVDFVKIDAEGEEANIIAGGERFLSNFSPLIQYELKAGNDYHLDLVSAFAARGYASYRLVPGLKALAPFDASVPPDDFLLNLFACKRETAQLLAARNLLVQPGHVERQHDEHLERSRGRGASRLRNALGAAQRWWRGTASDAAELDRALASYRFSRDAGRSLGARYSALQASVDALRGACDARPTPLRLASYARVLLDHGSRRAAADALTRLGSILSSLREVAADEPFLAPCEAFDVVERTGSLRDWLLAASLDAVERSCANSAYFGCEAAKARLTLLEQLGYANDDARRRLDLLRRQSAGPMPSAPGVEENVKRRDRCDG